jgi:murein DD-endopeptidase MepM/ murein hydrolase activator NlpD
VRFRSLSLALLLTILLTGLAGLPNALADPSDPSDPTPDPTSTPDPSPDPTTDPTPDPQPTEPSEPPPPDDGGGTPSPGPSPDNDGNGGKDGKGKQANDGKKDRNGKRKKDPFALAGPQNTARLFSLLAGLTQRGMSLEKAFLKVAGPFPVAGLAWWSDDWHACRAGCSRLHQGLDIFAPYGTPLVAAADGRISQKVNGGLSGLGLEITDSRGIQYFYAHLSAFQPGVDVGTEVKVGQIVGYVGDSGNARGTIPHVHFEYQPDGVPAPPKPWVDRWLKIAERRALELVHEVTGKKPKVERLTFRLTRLFALVDAERTDLDDGTGGNVGELLMLTGLAPAATYDMALETAGTMAWEIDWGEEAVDQITTGMREYQQEMAQQSLMDILQDPEAEATEPSVTGLLSGIGDVAAAEAIDPTAPVATEGGVVNVPSAPGGLTAIGTPETAAGLPVGAPGAVVSTTPQVVGSGTIGSATTTFGPSEPASTSWRTGVAPGLGRLLAVYGELSARLPGLTETVWDEVLAAIQEDGVKALVRGDTKARFPAAAGTP